jgi:hypothetical protein
MYMREISKKWDKIVEGLGKEAKEDGIAFIMLYQSYIEGEPKPRMAILGTHDSAQWESLADLMYSEDIAYLLSRKLFLERTRAVLKTGDKSKRGNDIPLWHEHSTETSNFPLDSNNPKKGE